MADRTTLRRPMLSKVGVCEASTVLRQLEAILQPNLDPEKEIVSLNLVAFPLIPVEIDRTGGLPDELHLAFAAEGTLPLVDEVRLKHFFRLAYFGPSVRRAGPRRKS